MCVETDDFGHQISRHFNVQSEEPHRQVEPQIQARDVRTPSFPPSLPFSLPPSLEALYLPTFSHLFDCL